MKTFFRVKIESILHYWSCNHKNIQISNKTFLFVVHIKICIYDTGGLTEYLHHFLFFYPTNERTFCHKTHRKLWDDTSPHHTYLVRMWWGYTSKIFIEKENLLWGSVWWFRLIHSDYFFSTFYSFHPLHYLFTPSVTTISHAVSSVDFLLLRYD